MHIFEGVDIINNQRKGSIPVKETYNSYEKTLFESKKYQEYIQQFNKTKNNTEIDINERILPKLTGKTLSGEGKIAYRGETYYFINGNYENSLEIIDKPIDNYSCTFIYLGDDLTGHPNIIHGGLLATLLDEHTCRLAFQNFYSKKGVTANLNINYRKPCYSNNYVLIKCEVLKKSGRKCWVKGSVFKAILDDDIAFESPENLLTECEILVIEPKWVGDL